MVTSGQNNRVSILFFQKFNSIEIIPLINFHQPLQSGDRLYTSESDVYRRQILTYIDGKTISNGRRPLT